MSEEPGREGGKRGREGREGGREGGKRGREEREGEREIKTEFEYLVSNFK